MRRDSPLSFNRNSKLTLTLIIFSAANALFALAFSSSSAAGSVVHLKARTKPQIYYGLQAPDFCKAAERARATGFDLAASQIAPTGAVLQEEELVNILNRQSKAPRYISKYGLTVPLLSGRKASADALKIIQTKRFSWPYVGVFHRFDRGDYFKTELVASRDLIEWHNLRTISDKASMPDIRLLPDGVVLYAEERNPSGTRPFIQISHYPNLNTFTNASMPTGYVALPLTDRASADGTPSFRRIWYNRDFKDSKIEITYHYFENSIDDKNASGVLSGFTSWSSLNAPRINTVLRTLGYNQVGGREIFRVRGTVYELLEARPSTQGSWAEWRLFLINKCTGHLRRLDPHLAGGAKSLGNPKLSFVRLPNGDAAVATSYFVFSEGRGNTPAGTHFDVTVLSPQNRHDGDINDNHDAVRSLEASTNPLKTTWLQ